ncbi:MAG: branched-chain amino acid ABC transporter permease [Angelakisella sp.]
MGLAKQFTPTQRRDFCLSAVSLLLVVVFLYLTQSGKTVGSYEVRILNLCAIYAVLGLSMNLVNGFTGLFSLGQAGFMALGAYVTTLLFMSPADKAMVFYLEPIVPWLGALQMPFFFALIIGGLVSAGAAFLIGFPVLRLRGDYLAIATLGFSEIIRVIFTNLQTITNGALGIKKIPPTANLWWTMGTLALVVVFLVRLMHGSYGRALKAIREDEIAAESMGIGLFRHKMMSFVISGFIAGVGGGLLASVVGAINPLLFRFVLAYDILLIVVLGGMGSITGTVISAFIITIAKEWLRFLDSGFSLGPIVIPEIAGLRMVVFSALLMMVILFFRRGLMGNKEFNWSMIIPKVKKPAIKGGDSA